MYIMCVYYINSLYREVDDSGILFNEKRILRKPLKQASKIARLTYYEINDNY